jgi:hypothetical protein
MPLIEVLTTPHRTTRIFFDCRTESPNPTDRARIAQVIEQSIALAVAEDAAQEALPLAA